MELGGLRMEHLRAGGWGRRADVGSIGMDSCPDAGIVCMGCCPVQAVCWDGEHTGRRPTNLTWHGILPSALIFSSSSRFVLKPESCVLVLHAKRWVYGSQIREVTR